LKLVEHREGGTTLLVPTVSLKQVPPPTSPVFFNPAASLNRDITVAITAATGGSSFCDSMAGVGSRGIRVATEVASLGKVHLVDFNKAALGIARRAARLNGVARKCEFTGSETSSFLHSRFGKDQRFDYVDVDPFGTPVRQLQAALGATADGGILSVTATDTAVLSGVYPQVARRRYGATPVNNRFNHETGIRILVGAVARMGAQLDLGAFPIAAHSTRHYLRVYLRAAAGASKADDALGHLGHLSWCPKCGHAALGEERTCKVCGAKTKVAGPLWTGAMMDGRVVKSAAKEAGARDLGLASRTLGAMLGVGDFPPWSFSIEAVCSSLGVPTVSEDSVYRKLVETGRRVMRTPFEKSGVKTDAPFSEFEDVVKQVAHGP
jgi:tRNA (guanine26-N2/guanine27-N2)-dimethyltransferase